MILSTTPLLSILQDLVGSLSIDEAGLLCSAIAEESDLIESANEVLSDTTIQNPHCRLWLLRDLIYTRLYLRPNPSREGSKSEASLYKNSMSGGVKSNFFQRLHQSNTGQGYGDSGWEVIAVEDDGYHQVCKAGLVLWIKPEKDLIRSSDHLNVGENVELRLPKNVLDPGIYVAVGNSGPVRPEQTATKIIQFHFNFESIQAPEILTHWTTVLNQALLPFCFAVGHETVNYDRADPGVLIVEKKNRSQILGLLQDFLVDHILRDETPVFTKQIALGVGYSEVPMSQPTPISFHLHRCQLIAQGLLAAWEEGNEAIASISKIFKASRISLDTPYLNPGAQDFNV